MSRPWSYASLLGPAAALFMPFYAAIALIVGISFLQFAELRHGIFVPTFANFGAAILDTFNFDVLINTVVVGLVVSVISAVAAIPMAYAIVRTQIRALRLTLILITIVPFLVNALVRVFAWTTVLGRQGFLSFILTHLDPSLHPRSLLRTETAVVLGQIYFVLPISIVTIIALLSKLNENIEHAASTLGANEWQTFFKITAPLLFPAIFSAGLVAYALTISAFVVPMILGGDQFKMYSNLIYDEVTFRGDFGVAAAMAVVLLCVSLILAGALRFVLKKTAGL
jgi:putative spermidine/putrescine transport system permease protein